VDLKKEFWMPDPALLGERLACCLSLSDARGEVVEIGRSFSDRPIYAIRYGSGPQKIAYVNALHGWEVVATNSSLAFVWSLFAGRGLDGEDMSDLAEEVARRQTVWVLPLCSPDIAARQYKRFPEGFFPNAIGSKTKEDRLEYVRVMNDPHERYPGQFGAGRDHGFTPEQVAEWLSENEYLGQRWSDQGLDVWVDFEPFDSPEARAARDFMLAVRPDCVMEYHGHEGATFVTAPTPLAAPGKAARQGEFGRRMVAALVATGLKCATEPVNLYLKEDSPTFVNWVDTQMPETMMLFAELQMYHNDWLERGRPHPAFAAAAGRPMPTQAEIIRSGWTLSMALLEMGNEHTYRTPG